MRIQEARYMQEALRLAKKGISLTFPNPLVGAVLVKNGEIIGKGYHKGIGLPHAEIDAFTSATENPIGATLYVTLEPCSHYGHTPPCVKEIIKKGIAKVVCASIDPNTKVHEKGINILKKAGIEVSVGLLEEKAKKLNEGFFTFHTQKRPFVAIKFAASLDGKIATKKGESKWITSERSRIIARQLRAQYHAILVGINTILSDNPHLGVREKGIKDPLRIILDTTLKIPLTSEVLRNKNVLIVTSNAANERKKNLLIKKGIEILTQRKNHISIPDLLHALYKKKIISILVEGGGEVLGSFVDLKCIDRIYAFYSPILIGGRTALSAIAGEGIENLSEALHIENILYKKFTSDLLIIGDILGKEKSEVKS
jgi:diaminohydroxyphosphoribosylaminopyrimidine deaminase/5-amino-6-(5-phosphoribosylamino)uracil reductase